MILRRVVPAAGGALDTDAPDARPTLLDWYAPHDPEHLRLNLVATLDGRAAGSDGTSESLASRTDRMILGVIRQLADVVLVGAESVRREGYVRPRRAALAIVTASGDLTGHRLDEQRPNQKLADPQRQTAAADGATALPPVIVLTTATGAERATTGMPGAALLILPTAHDGRIPPSEIVSVLRTQGYRGIAAEGGPSLAAQLLTANAVDELCLTVIPRLGGPALPLLGAHALSATSATARQLLIDEAGVTYGRWSLRP